MAYCEICDSEDCRCDREEGSLSTPSATPAQLHTSPKLASDQDILGRFLRVLRVCGVVGEERNAKVVFLALVTRLMAEPTSLVIKGLSSSGKSYTVETVLKFFPPDAYIEMTAMSERALVYMQEEFTHRTLVLFEAVALREQREKAESNLTAYFVRSLLSEGRISYPVTVRDKDGNFVTKRIEKKGPTNLVLTTTATKVHAENETRLLSLPTDDSSDQTHAVLMQLAAGPGEGVDFKEWHDLQRWLQGAERRVEIPFAKDLAEAIPPVAVRLRRDFKAVLNLIKAHALLHQLSREHDDAGRIIATPEDYEAVRALVADLIAAGVEATVPATMRETVGAVAELKPRHEDGVPVIEVAKHLKLDRSAASRRLVAARERNLIVNLEERRGRPARYKLGEPMPEEQPLLPHICTGPSSESACQEGVCSSAAVHEEEREDAAEKEGADEEAALRLVADTFHATPMASEPAFLAREEVAPTRPLAHTGLTTASVLTKPDVGTGVSHPARFSQALFPVFARVLEGCTTILDPFAGTGRIHKLMETLHGFETFGVELEPEWATCHPRTIVGDALDLPFPDNSFDAICTSPCYGNRLADHHNASDPEDRRSYTHDLGRPLHPHNSGQLQWGEPYREFHRQAWREAIRVLKPGGRFVLNIKDHIRDGTRQRVSRWHLDTLQELGLTLVWEEQVATPSMRAGANRSLRLEENVYVLQSARARRDTQVVEEIEH